MGKFGPMGLSEGPSDGGSWNWRKNDASLHEDASLVPEGCLGMVARLAISICLTLPNNYYNPSPNIHITGWQAESNPFTICFVKWPMENISFSQCPAPKSSNLPTIAFWEPNLPTKTRNCNFRHFRDII